MLANYETDELADGDPQLDAPEPMHPIRIARETLTANVSIQIDLLERLGLVHARVGQNLFALNECDSNAVRPTAIEQLTAEGLTPPLMTEYAVTRRCEALLHKTVCEQALTVRRSALHPPMSEQVAMVAQELHAEADERLMANGVNLKAQRDHLRAEFEAA